MLKKKAEWRVGKNIQCRLIELQLELFIGATSFTSLALSWSSTMKLGRKDLDFYFRHRSNGTTQFRSRDYSYNNNGNNRVLT